jgi:hypothetical protein
MKIRLKKEYSRCVHEGGTLRAIFLQTEDPDFKAPEGYQVFVGAFEIDPAIAAVLLATGSFEEVEEASPPPKKGR